MPDTLFHNPYHFVPINTQPGPGSLELCKDPATESRSLAKTPEHFTHERCVATTTVDGKDEPVFSGRIVCRMKVCESLAVGNHQKTGEKDKTNREVSLFKIGSRWAVPGSALRGLVSSIAEAASNSAMRILENEPYSRSQGKGQPRKPLGAPFEYFKRHFPESLPLHFRDGRSRLSIAEQLFGVIEAVPKCAKTPKNWKAISFAGRLRFSNALASPDVHERDGDMPVTQILDSPKPPSSAMYLQPSTSEGFIGKLDVKPASHAPQGRKFYLHRKKLTDADWISRDPTDQPHQKAKVRPLTGGEFWFHIDFDNVSKLELELLCFALNPSDAFHHKLGMGKPLGLGKVKIEPAGLFLIKRTLRYSGDALSKPRFHQLQRAVSAEQWPGEYSEEQKAPAENEAPAPATLRDEYIARVAADFPQLVPILKSIQLIGDPDSAKSAVHYPQPLHRMKMRLSGAEKGNKDKTLADVKGIEMERNSYEWFVANDQQAGQYLRPLTKENTADFKSLPTLDREARKEPPSPAAIVQAAPPAAAAGATWSAPVECVYEGPEIGVGARRKFRTKDKLGTSDGNPCNIRGMLAGNADATRLPRPLNVGTRVTLRYTSVNGQTVFDFPPAT